MGGPHGHPVLGALLAQRNCSRSTARYLPSRLTPSRRHGEALPDELASVGAFGRIAWMMGIPMRSRPVMFAMRVIPRREQRAYPLQRLFGGQVRWVVSTNPWPPGTPSREADRRRRACTGWNLGGRVTALLPHTRRRLLEAPLRKWQPVPPHNRRDISWPVTWPATIAHRTTTPPPNIARHYFFEVNTQTSSRLPAWADMRTLPPEEPGQPGENLVPRWAPCYPDGRSDRRSDGLLDQRP